MQSRWCRTFSAHRRINGRAVIFIKHTPKPGTPLGTWYKFPFEYVCLWQFTCAMCAGFLGTGVCVTCFVLNAIFLSFSSEHGHHMHPSLRPSSPCRSTEKMFSQMMDFWWFTIVEPKRHCLKNKSKWGTMLWRLFHSPWISMQNIELISSNFLREKNTKKS